MPKSERWFVDAVVTFSTDENAEFDIFPTRKFATNPTGKHSLSATCSYAVQHWLSTEEQRGCHRGREGVDAWLPANRVLSEASVRCKEVLTSGNRRWWILLVLWLDPRDERPNPAVRRENVSTCSEEIRIRVDVVIHQADKIAAGLQEPSNTSVVGAWLSFGSYPNGNVPGGESGDFRGGRNCRERAVLRGIIDDEN
jgi:hypothetical protein